MSVCPSILLLVHPADPYLIFPFCEIALKNSVRAFFSSLLFKASSLILDLISAFDSSIQYLGLPKDFTVLSSYLLYRSITSKKNYFARAKARERALARIEIGRAE